MRAFSVCSLILPWRWCYRCFLIEFPIWYFVHILIIVCPLSVLVYQSVSQSFSKTVYLSVCLSVCLPSWMFLRFRLSSLQVFNDSLRKRLIRVFRDSTVKNEAHTHTHLPTPFVVPPNQRGVNKNKTNPHKKKKNCHTKLFVTPQNKHGRAFTLQKGGGGVSVSWRVYDAVTWLEGETFCTFVCLCVCLVWLFLVVTLGG